MFTKRRLELFVPAFLICLVAGPFVVALMVSRGAPAQLNGISETNRTSEEKEPSVTHTSLPDEVRGIYWTATTALSTRADELLAYMLDTGLNTVVIDAKYDNGALAFSFGSDAILSYEKKAFTDEKLGALLAKLHDANVYRIARIAVMRDGAFAAVHPEVALRTASGALWQDKVGSVWVDPASALVAQNAIDVGRVLYAAGFDEIQYDYVRFASDGSVNSIVYPIYNGTDSKTAVMQKFFKTVGGTLQEEGIPVSFDLFGMTFWSLSDFNIGQRLVDALPYADFISPMVYPSHYPDGFKGYGNPAEYPYEIVKRSLDEGLRLMHGFWAGSDDDLAKRFRPWLQDFDIGAMYTADKIEAEIQAARDAGASGWILWNARNVYEEAAYVK